MAVGFNASGDYAKRTGAPAFSMVNNTDKFTMAGWIKFRDITPGAWSYPFGVEDADASSTYYALIGITNTDSTELATHGGGPDFGTQPSQDTWYYFYIIGQNIGSDVIVFDAGYYTAAGGAPVSTVNEDATDFNVARIGLGGDSWDEWLDCVIAYVRVWTGVALTDAELRTERDSATAVRTSGLWADWPLANNTDTGDDSGNGRDLTFGGTLTTETGPLGLD